MVLGGTSLKYAVMIRSLKSELQEILVFASPISILLSSGNCTLIFLWEVIPSPFYVHVVQVAFSLFYFKFQMLAHEPDRPIRACHPWHRDWQMT